MCNGMCNENTFQDQHSLNVQVTHNQRLYLCLNLCSLLVVIFQTIMSVFAILLPVHIVQKKLLVSAIFKNDRADIPFSTFLKNFWDYDNSPYIREKLRKKHSIHKRYVGRQSGAIKNYWKPYH